ncbi:MAG: transketolase [Bacteroidetes bacterium]|nr:MAG: transketolase [Bacteroidota bacterium]TAE67419.1 MAG: transketolase [Bacteroidota bacterium]TAF93974.1 MAG: transketolase [Bacteroidota bacterium]
MSTENFEQATEAAMLSFDGFKNTVLADYALAVRSREISLTGRREVLTGKAKFGIFGDGKEVAQIAMAKFFEPGDFRSGYYRDQTFMFATGTATPQQFFAQLYADANVQNEPFSAGRLMNGHYSSKLIDEDGNWLPLAQLKNISSDISPTAGQMPRGLGLAFASKAFRNIPALKNLSHLSNNGNEVCFVTIGDASTSEGHFWETINAAGVLQVPMAVFVYDDGYGISVPKEYQTTKGSISTLLKGFQQHGHSNGLDIYKVKGWDYAGMCELFETAIQKIRTTHIPAVFHIEEVTQPQGHSTSGSHERYKTQDRLEWEKNWDCIKKMREWIIENGIATAEELVQIEIEEKTAVKTVRQQAWQNYIVPIQQWVTRVCNELSGVTVSNMDDYAALQKITTDLAAIKEPILKDIAKALAKASYLLGKSPSAETIAQLQKELLAEGAEKYNSHLYFQGAKSALQVAEVKASYNNDAATVNGYEVLNAYFDQLFANNDNVLAFGEDVGHIGDVNQGFSGLQEKYGKDRIFDTGIRELTIAGQGIGLALRGLRPIAEIQYLDYLLYALQPLSDDVATLQYRTKGQQACPLIIRTRGHRLEGVWHSGSPMGMILHSVRGMHVCVPRNMTQAAGMYNTLLKGIDPAIVIECLNGYRLKEAMPTNLAEFTVPLGVPEILKTGNDVTIVSYGSTLRIVQEAAELAEQLGISCEVIDVQTLLPFDVNHSIVTSIKKTNNLLIVDEDVPGGAAAYMFNEIIEKQGAYRWLDAAPKTLTAKAHRPAYGTDGDYFSKPNVEEIISTLQQLMAE